LTFAVSELLKSLAKGLKHSRSRSRAGIERQDRDSGRRLRSRLRLGGERRGEETNRSGEKRSATRHWITSSARASTAGGVVRLRVLAVLRLMTSLNLVACSTGRSPGLAPFRILATNEAACRCASALSAP